MSKYFYIFLFILLWGSVAAQNPSIVNTCTKSNVRKGFYNWTIYVSANESILNDIDHIEYLLDPTFRNPLVLSYDRQSKFSYKAVGWGEFEIKGTIYFKDKTKPVNLTHWLSLN